MAPTSNLGEFEQVVLLAVLQLGDEASTSPLLEAIAHHTGRSVARGALYTTLDRLEQKGLLRSRMAGGSRARSGRPRRYYQVTAVGIRALKESRQALLSLWRGLEGLLGS